MTIQDHLEDVVQAYHDGLLDASSCEEWPFSRQGNRYGRFRLNGEKVLAHRWVFGQVHGSVDPRLVVRHRCGNAWCLNPHHLVTGTQADNMRDAQGHGTIPVAKCGTWSGYNAHKKKGEDACDDCRLAANAYQKKYADANRDRHLASARKKTAAYRARMVAEDPAAWKARQDCNNAKKRAKRAVLNESTTDIALRSYK